MINFVIRLVKNSPFLYNLAKKILRRNEQDYGLYAIPKSELVFYAYTLKSLEELEVIRKKYENLQKYNTKLFVLVDNQNYNIVMHKLIRENPDICFTSLYYFKKYCEKLFIKNIIWLNFTEDEPELLDYLD